MVLLLGLMPNNEIIPQKSILTAFTMGFHLFALLLSLVWTQPVLLKDIFDSLSSCLASAYFNFLLKHFLINGNTSGSEVPFDITCKHFTLLAVASSSLLTSFTSPVSLEHPDALQAALLLHLLDTSTRHGNPPIC